MKPVNIIANKKNGNNFILPATAPETIDIAVEQLQEE